MKEKDVKLYNQAVWDTYGKRDNQWTVAVDRDVIDSSREGRISVLLTPLKTVPDTWFPDLKGLKVLGLASAGGQQMPMFAAAGALVTSLDISEYQLSQDKMVAERNGLTLTLIKGDMADLSMFDTESFDLIFHPVSNCFVPDIMPVWKECFRVLKPNGILMAGFANPLLYMFDDVNEHADPLKVAHSIPYSDVDFLTATQQKEYREKSWAFEFGHSLTDQIGGQLKAGFFLKDFYEDYHHRQDHPLNPYVSTFIATLAVKK